ncbi:hypothetical protein Enr13x_12460 [Stieleria neptunia]|uniref:Uncharacterized protein n=1 Tax=Stieleria neptunia TaxID=2527979 RepID=A0A518HKP6_9BACT|nr:hypothetical protein Enr13x_12460 [Stieleria neptunia]
MSRSHPPSAITIVKWQLLANHLDSLPLGERAFAQQANAREGRRCKSRCTLRYDQIRHLNN